ncbi:Oxidoreductase NAD-binding domain-containing protein 1 [Hypsibius exemplaris]|uniref:Oxidoreductase NAD-binding domain-containing protein 1 n=1 Tax=Hypsibius exemplaris TaxID=2072580 RepID=A0A1W0WVD4_HYPEX|nr:Oxidoreductase NAD-binding domain-containing protein 1 [Hypsibius exemplaris]
MFHLNITAGQARGEVISKAVVKEIRDLSRTVKKVDLEIKDPRFTFKAGQWVDFFIPDVEVVGGFSICSAPKLLKDKRLIELAIKRSPHPPVVWIHEKCQIGSEVDVRAGGDFFYDPQPGDPPVDLLLLAGGVGINPLRSMFIHDADLAREFKENGSGYCPGSAELLYSAKTVDELLFKDDFLAAAMEPNFNCTLFSSQSMQMALYGTGACIQPGRITDLDILTTITGEKAVLHKDRLLCYICGPRAMVNSLVPALENCGVPKDKIVYEAWTNTPPKTPAAPVPN